MYLLLFIRLSSSLDEVIVFPIPAALYLVKNLLQVGCGSLFIFFYFLCLKFYSSFCLLVFQKLSEYIFSFLLQYYIFAYVDAPGYQILKNLNIISTGVLYRIILKKKWVLLIYYTGYSPLHMESLQTTHTKVFYCNDKQW